MYAGFVLNEKSCIYQTEEIREAKGCMVSCSCPRRKNKLYEYDWILQYNRLWESNKIGLTDVEPRTYQIIDYYNIELSNQRAEAAERAKKVAEKLGSSGNNPRKDRRGA